MDVVLREAEANEATKVVGIKIKVGKFTSIVPDCVQFYFEIISRDTLAEGARLEFDHVDLRILCKECGQISTLDDGYCLLCPHCGSSTVQIVSGRELFIESLEVE